MEAERVFLACTDYAPVPAGLCESLSTQWLYARSPVLVSKNGNDYDVTDCDVKGFEVALALVTVWLPFRYVTVTSPLITRLSNLQTVAGLRL
ncbi:hypothetical protein J6590_085730 [Homalodisca vitripennis]|nr:hypothetical protein J6590_085730 [Homalodisca vitripennis]